MKKAAIYARVSSERQAGNDRVSIEVQLAESEAYCKERGYVVVGRYIDCEKSDWPTDLTLRQDQNLPKMTSGYVLSPISNEIWREK